MIGYGDNIGSGFQKILSAWRTLRYPAPDLNEVEDVNEVWLTLPMPTGIFDNHSGHTESDAGNDAENDVENDAKNDAKKVSERQQAILNIIRSNKSASAKDISKLLSTSHATIQREIKLLKDKNILVRIGPDKGGSWGIL